MPLPWAVRLVLAATAGLIASAGPGWAQKYPGQTIPDDVAPPRVAPYRPVPPLPRPATGPQAAYPRSVPVPPGGGAERDAQARDLAGQLPLDPATANLQSRLPTDVPGTERRLGLRVPTGGRIDLRGRRTTPGEVTDALQH